MTEKECMQGKYLGFNFFLLEQSMGLKIDVGLMV